MQFNSRKFELIYPYFDIGNNPINISIMAQFEKFWGILSQNLELPDESKPILKNAWDQCYIEPTASPAAGESKPRKAGHINGYNLFMKEKLEELKKDPTLKGRERMGKVALLWKEVPEDQKKAYSAKAATIAPSEPAAPKKTKKSSAAATSSEAGPKAKRAPSGYNIFMKVKMGELKAQGVPSGDRMKKMSEMWKALSDDEKKNWKDRAANGENVPTPPASPVSLTPAPAPVSMPPPVTEAPAPAAVVKK